GQVAEFAASGAVVTGFGTDGVACIDFPGFSGAADLAVQGDGQVLVLGERQLLAEARHIALARLSATGATVDRVVQPLSSDFEYADELAIQADGRVVVAGRTHSQPSSGGPSQVGVVLSRYLGDTLAPDESFGGGDGINTESIFLDQSSGGLQLALQPNGTGISVAVAGRSSSSGGGQDAAIEQLLFGGDGNLSDSPSDVMLTGHSFAELD